MSRRLRRIVGGLLLALLLVWSGLCALLYFSQRDMLFHPQPLALADAQAWAREHAAQVLQDADGRVLGWQFQPAQAACTSSWLMAHGNAGMALQRGFVAQRLRDQLGAATCLTVIEYPGFGAAGGTPSQQSLVVQGERVMTALAAQGHNRLFLIGESLGTGVVAELAARHPQQVAALLLLTPYDDLAAVAQEHFPWLPMPWLLRDRFTPGLALAAYPGPVQLVVAGADQTIPPVHAQRLAAQLRDARTHVEKGLDHNDLEQRPQWWSLVTGLVERADRPIR